MAFEVSHVTTVDDAIVALKKDGVAVIDNALGAEQLKRLHDKVYGQLDADRAAGTLWNDPGDTNERVLDLVSLDKMFRDMIEDPMSLDIASRWIKPGFRLSSFGANVTVPGSKAMFMHADQSYIPSPWPIYPLALNLIWALDDFTLESGATHIVPGSHRETRAPEPGEEHPTAVPVLCKAGSLVLMDGRVWHRTGKNTTTDRKRAALLLYFVNAFIISQRDWHALISPELRSELSPLLNELLGFGDRATAHIRAPYKAAEAA